MYGEQLSKQLEAVVTDVKKDGNEQSATDLPSILKKEKGLALNHPGSSLRCVQKLKHGN